MLDKEQKQVTLLEGHGIGVDKKLIFYGAEYWYRGKYGQVVSNQKVGVFLDIKNEKPNHLGMPLPKGMVRVYKADKSGAKQFIGEDNIDHTPRDEKVRIKMGEAFDVVGDRKQTEWTAISARAPPRAPGRSRSATTRTAPRASRSTSRSAATGRSCNESHPHKKKDAHTFTFDVKVPARGKTKITYRVRVRWC